MNEWVIDSGSFVEQWEREGEDNIEAPDTNQSFLMMEPVAWNIKYN